MTTRSLYPSGQQSQFGEDRQSHHPHNAAFPQGRQSKPESQACNLPKHTQALRDLRLIYALERRSLL